MSVGNVIFEISQCWLSGGAFFNSEPLHVSCLAKSVVTPGHALSGARTPRVCVPDKKKTRVH